MSRNKKQEPNFEEALVRLGEIVRDLEQGEIKLDETLKLFEEGVKLARFCNQKLDEVEGKIEIMLKEGQTEAFEVND